MHNGTSSQPNGDHPGHGLQVNIVGIQGLSVGSSESGRKFGSGAAVYCACEILGKPGSGGREARG